MGRSIWIVMVVVCVGGCEKKQPHFEGPMRVAFGDCAGPSVSWVSGPRPLAFTAEEAERVRTAKLDKPEPKREPKVVKLTPEQAIEQARNAGKLDTEALQQGGAVATITGGTGADDSNIYGGLLGNEAGEMNGGFGYGRSGFGPGGGGTGWGTIGVGKYGKIGHGAGTGYGIRTTSPTVSIGQPNAQGELDKAIIRRYIKRNIQKIEYCYEKELLAKPKLQGTVATQFLILETGHVGQSTGSGVDPNVANCVANVIKTIEFPKPKNGVVQVAYPFTFRPVTGGGIVSLLGSGSGSAATPPPAPAEPPPKPESPPRPARVDNKPYEPGSANPLRTEEAALAECFRKNPKPYGAIVVQLEFDAAGAVKSATSYGLDNDDTKQCVAEAVKPAKRSTGGAGSQRCSIAFGEMPLDEAPTIDITATDIAMNGRVVSTVAEAVSKGSPVTFRIERVFDGIKQGVELARAPSAPVVAIRGPGVIRPLDTTPMAVVDRVMSSVLAAGDDYVLAAREIKPAEEPRWALLRPIKSGVPVVPVPIGTGGSWTNLHRYGVIDGERVSLSILVQADHIWIGISRINEFTEIKRDGTEWKQLAEKLQAQKKSAFFVDRDDLEIAGEGVNYGDVVKAVMAATDAGFVWWRVMPPTDISARPTL